MTCPFLWIHLGLASLVVVGIFVQVYLIASRRRRDRDDPDGPGRGRRVGRGSPRVFALIGLVLAAIAAHRSVRALGLGRRGAADPA